MRIQIEPTEHVVSLNGTRLRLWNGVTQQGFHVFLLIHRIGVHIGEDCSAFESELQEVAPADVNEISEIQVDHAFLADLLDPEELII